MHLCIFKTYNKLTAEFLILYYVLIVSIYVKTEVFDIFTFYVLVFGCDQRLLLDLWQDRSKHLTIIKRLNEGANKNECSSKKTKTKVKEVKTKREWIHHHI